MDDTYWTGYPTAEDPYANPVPNWGNSRSMMVRLKPRTTVADESALERLTTPSPEIRPSRIEDRSMKTYATYLAKRLRSSSSWSSWASTSPI